MSSKSTSGAFTAYSLLAVCFAGPGCVTEPATEGLVAALRSPLEESCTQSAADVTGDVFAILGSKASLDPAEPQEYGSAACSGVVFELDNPDLEPLRGAWVQASGTSHDDSDPLSESRCPERQLQAEYWGYADNAWTKLAAAEEAAGFDADSQYCDLDALMMFEGTFEKLRIVARVSQQAETYPMQACVW